MKESEKPSDKNIENKDKLDTKLVVPLALLNIKMPKINPKLIEDIQNIQSSYAKMAANIQVPKLNPELIESIQNIQVPKLNPELIESIQSIQSSYAQMATNIQVPKINPGLIGLVGNVNYLTNPSIEETELLNVSAEDPRQIFSGSPLNFEKPVELESFDDETQNDYEITNFKFNNEAYRFLCNLETYLRYLITKRIIEPNEKNLGSKIPQDVLSRWEERKRHDTLSEYNLIDYSDFTDLKIIFEKGKNKNLFKDIFNDEEYRALITKLHELDPIRKKIAHFRPVTENEFNRLVMYHDDIFLIVNARQS